MSEKLAHGDALERLIARLHDMHAHLGYERGHMTALYGDTTLLEVSLLLKEAADVLAAVRQPSPAEKEKPLPVTGKRWTDVLCTQCGGNGVIKIHHGTSVCPRCDGRCYEPDVSAGGDERKEAVPATTPCTSAHDHSVYGYDYYCAVCGKRIAGVGGEPPELTREWLLKRNAWLNAELERMEAELRASGTPEPPAAPSQEHTVNVMYPNGLNAREHAILYAREWQVRHPDNCPAFQAILGLLQLLPFEEVQAATAKAPQAVALRTDMTNWDAQIAREAAAADAKLRALPRYQLHHCNDMGEDYMNRCYVVAKPTNGGEEVLSGNHEWIRADELDAALRQEERP